MDKLTMAEKPIMPVNTFEETVLTEKERKSKAAKSFINHAGLTIGAFIMLVVAFVTTMDISIISLVDIASLGLNYFVFLFGSYYVYISWMDSGKRAGLRSNAYMEANKVYWELKDVIEKRHMQRLLFPFCKDYVERELETVRTSILSIVGVDYVEYKSTWLAADVDCINNSKELTKAQKKAIIKANGVKAIKLNPEMFMRAGHGTKRRAPLGIAPSTKKEIQSGLRLLSSVCVSLVTTLIAFDGTAELVLAKVAPCMLNLVIIAANGFSGYRHGFENIVVDSVNYISGQSDLVREFIDYAEQEARHGEESTVKS
jgi:hypothetical protein